MVLVTAFGGWGATTSAWAVTAVHAAWVMSAPPITKLDSWGDSRILIFPLLPLVTLTHNQGEIETKI